MPYNIYQDGLKVKEDLKTKSNTIAGLEPETEYEFAVTQVMDGRESEKTKVIVTTTAVEKE